MSEDDELENIVDAILKQKAMAMDAGYVADVVKNLYRFRNDEQKHVGTDVLALDILRGRDHGLNGYVKYLELCTEDHNITGWGDLRRYIGAEVRTELFDKFNISHTLMLIEIKLSHMKHVIAMGRAIPLDEIAHCVKLSDYWTVSIYCSVYGDMSIWK